ncbi:MAG: 30S ribosomal protein S12 methylthiotransferase RimO [Firmicutes bacterium]|nr:30S ribosomal protein S12 methylthiotransferase RimO [Bacillota bacterium]
MKKISFVSLGCDKNTIDSEIMLSLLTDHGYEITKNDDQADAIVINTCAFIADAQEESINTIIEMGRYKEEGVCQYLVVTGCLAQRFHKEIFEDLPEVDAVVGTGSYEKIVDVLDELFGTAKKLEVLDPIDHRPLGYYKRSITTPGHYEFLKLSVGCDNHCTYCIIPMLRGPYRSRAKEDILHDAQDLADQGVKELLLVAQDITKYGRDLYEDYQLPELLKDLCKIDGIEWIRLLYCYPEDVTDALIRTMKEEPKILPYIDIPIQHCSDSVLKRMGRHHTKALLENLLQRLRDAMPDICIRTTLITGFPGESDEEFEEMLDFVENSRFDRLGVFCYSQEDGTPAARMKDQIAEDVKESRKDQLMALQQQISEEKSASMVGKVLDVMVEGRIPEEEAPDGTNVYVARTYRDAPDIDGFIFVSCSYELRSGDILKVRVTGAYAYDLIGEVVENENESSQ